ncbi:MAG: TolC family protein [Myxococcales bacterium]|nr:TolC family protein [Myxococcales bacterium]MCB9630502.1 TolC family protein [Sandaracinaceae bacterium]
MSRVQRVAGWLGSSGRSDGGLVARVLVLGVALVQLSGACTARVHAQPDPSAPLTVEQVLRSTAEHHPSVQAALANESVAEAELLRARGAFDPTLSVRGALRHGGYYELRRVDAELRAPTPWLGAEFWAGYRYGQGVDADERYPTYYSDQTLDRGELRAGVRVPLLRDRALDDRRAGRLRAELQVEAAGQTRALALIELERRAAAAYWSWVAAGRAQAVCQELLTLAEERLSAVTRRAEEGLIPDVEAIEAERSLLARTDCVIQARRGVEAAALVLGLFVRTAEGNPAPPPSTRLPSTLPVPSEPADVASAFERVVACHPRLAAKRAQLASQRVSRDLARARTSPRLDAQAQVSRDIGDGSSTLPGTVYEVGLQFSMPLALREARGQLAAAEAQLSVVEQELRLLEDELRAELADIVSAHQAASERHELLARLEETTRRLAEAERRRFEMGATSLLVVNLREQSVGEASMSLLQALRALWEQSVRWEAATRCS